MLDLLPYLDLRSKTTPEQVAEIANYLVRLKDELENVLTTISEENLSPELLEKINSSKEVNNG